MKALTTAGLTLSLMTLATASALAQSMGSGDLSIGGFGTLGIARTNTDAAQFVRYNQAEGVTTRAGVGTDSNLGLQASYKISPEVSATAQILTRKNTSTTFTTELTWAFLKARLNDDFSIRGGRIVIPGFMISDYQNVGYANTMIRPPIELYGQAPLESADGADISYQHSFGDTTVSAQGMIGVASGKLFVAAGGGSVAHYRAPLAALSVSAENGPFMLRFAHLRTKIESDDFTVLESLVKTLGSAGFGQLGKDLTLNGGKRINFTALGATMDHSNIVLQAEYGIRTAKEPVYIADNTAWYVMAGYRIGKVLPYYNHADVRQASRSVSLPASFPKSGALFAAVDTSFLTANLQKTDTIGVRWDFAKSLALKLQMDRVHIKTKNGALIFGPAAGMSSPVTATSIAVDAVF
jgi:hypothetical protein